MSILLTCFLGPSGPHMTSCFGFPFVVSGPFGRTLHLLRKPLPVFGGESEVEESVCVRSEQLRHQPV